MRAVLASVSFLVLASTALAAEPVRLAAHRAIYDLSLVKGGGAPGVEAASGRIVIEFTGNACEGWASKYRQVTVLESGETGSKTSDMRNATFEGDDGRSFRFRTDSVSNGRTDTVDGDAAVEASGAVAVRLKQPAPRPHACAPSMSSHSSKLPSAISTTSCAACGLAASSTSFRPSRQCRRS